MKKIMIKQLIKVIKSNFFKKKSIRKELRFVSYEEADALIKKGWTIAKEEDNNHKPFFVYIELLEGAQPPPLKNML
jgi:hypothetical protein